MIFILLPAYNEENSIKALLPKLINELKTLDEEWQIVLCDDGSSDRTKEEFLHFSNEASLKLLSHQINRGLGETVRDLFEYAANTGKTGDIAIRLDCDDTHDPTTIKKMIRKIKEGYQVVIASRFQKGGGQKGIPPYRALVSYAANAFMKIVFPMNGVRDYSSGFRAYDVGLLKQAIQLYGNQFIQLKGLGFTCTLEKIVKLKILKPKMAEVANTLKYDQKKSDSKMVSSITTFGYLTMAFLYHWPWGGWRINYGKKFKNMKQAD